MYIESVTISNSLKLKICVLASQYEKDFLIKTYDEIWRKA